MSWALVGMGCASLPVAEKLASVGLALVSEEEAQIPAPERGKAVPCRTLDSAPQPALPPHPAGYLLVKVLDAQGDRSGAQAVLAALEAWKSGQTLVLRARRNPYAIDGSEWWEAEVKLKLP